MVGDSHSSRSIIGGSFTATALGETMVGRHRAVLPRITGSAWIYGRESLRLSPDDPFRTGLMLSDPWGPRVADLCSRCRLSLASALSRATFFRCACSWP
jgi:proline racemase